MHEIRYYTAEEFQEDIRRSRQRAGYRSDVPLDIQADVSIYAAYTGQHFDRKLMRVCKAGDKPPERGGGYYVIYNDKAHLLGVSGGYRFIVTSDPALYGADKKENA